MTGTDAAAVAGKLTEGSAERRLAERIGTRWIKGTGFCHSVVGRDLKALGLVESRTHRNERQIRATPLGRSVRNHLLASLAKDTPQ